MRVVTRIYLLFTILFLTVSSQLFSQLNSVKGIVLEQNENLVSVPLYGASIYWLGLTDGTSSDGEGKFEIPLSETTDLLVVSFSGFKSDTIHIDKSNLDKPIKVVLASGLELGTVDIQVHEKSTQISHLTTLKTERIGTNELRKAACCNLSESFETSPSIDVSFTDAVTGTRQIQMLGLAGTYSQITVEGMPDVRGLSSITGLQFIPGAWIKGIQLNKGAGTVVNGFESITGQINVDLRSPTDEEKVHVNLYGNYMSRLEGNYILRKKINDKLSTSLLVHHNHTKVGHDNNKDGFHDHLIGDAFTAMNRWKFVGKNGIQSQIAFRGLFSDKISGQFTPSITTPYNINLINKRAEVWGKTGYLFPNNEFSSIGFQWKLVNQEVDYKFGNTNYQGIQKSAYANFLYQGILGNTNHLITSGASLVVDDYEESIFNTNYNRKEIVPGVYGEYTYNKGEKWNIVLGLRGDYHNNYGTFVTPRMHFRYVLNENAVFRTSMGRGLRTANIFAENFGALASNREWIINSQDNDNPYGLSPEIAWNGGVNFTQDFKLDYREGTIAFDFYRSQFENQIVVDYDEDPNTLHVYNLTGESFSNSIQVQVDYELIKRLDFKVAYRLFDVKTTLNNELQNKPLLARDRAFVNLSYETKNHWSFDYTVQWQGPKRIPSIDPSSNSEAIRDVSPSFFLMNSQISKEWKEKYEWYIGVENMTNYTQKNPIIGVDNPYGSDYDASLIWGPIFGMNVYAGLRINLI